MHEPAGYIYTGQVYHCRNTPKIHAFNVPVFYVALDVQKKETLSNRFFSLNRWNFLSLYDSDYGSPEVKRQESQTKPMDWVKTCFTQIGLQFEPTTVWIQTFPRVMGYAFNPISFWYCYDDQRHLRAVLCEVNNTFGETHNYVVRHSDLRPIRKDDRFIAEKVFHVSPFFPVRGKYEFRFQGDPLEAIGGENHVHIFYYENESSKPALVTYIKGERLILDNANLKRALFSNPLLTFKVTFLIHLHALYLFFKGAKFFKKPVPPSTQTT